MTKMFWKMCFLHLACSMQDFGHPEGNDILCKMEDISQSHDLIPTITNLMQRKDGIFSLCADRPPRKTDLHVIK